jgi:hypothetical protein
MLIVGYQFIFTSPAPSRELAYAALLNRMDSGKVARAWFVGSHGATVGRIDRLWGGFTRFARVLAIVDIRGALFCGILLDRSLPDRTTET